jgi:hypothetical protein
MVMRRKGLWIQPLALLLVASGCGKSVKLVKTEVVVLLDGKPVSEATLQFVPTQGSSGQPASGRTGSDGHARMTTYTTGDGAVPGVYEVLISKTEPAAATTTSPAAGDRDKLKSAMFAQMIKASKPQKKTPGEIPASYGTVGKSGLRCTVPSESVVTFELRSTGGT